MPLHIVTPSPLRLPNIRQAEELVSEKGRLLALLRRREEEIETLHAALAQAMPDRADGQGAGRLAPTSLSLNVSRSLFTFFGSHTS